MPPCPPVEHLQLLLDDQLSTIAEQVVAAHVDGCSDCQEQLEQLTRAAEFRSRAQPDDCLARAVSTVPELRWRETPLPAPPEPDAEITSPAEKSWPQVEGYEILGELGRGGMGVVYKARQQGLQRLVALKMILQGAQAGVEQFTRFRREAEAIARLQHPHIVQLHEIGEQEGRPFFSMELVSGGSLADRLRGTPLAVREAATVVQTLAGAVHAAHQGGIIHRDLKPANVLLSADGTLKLSDFDLAKQVSGSGQPTRAGEIFGTPSYMAPEQASGVTKAIGPVTDVYGLAPCCTSC